MPDPLEIEPIDENEVSYRTDHDFGDHIVYSGQLKTIHTEGEPDYLQHGRGKQQWPDGSRYEGEWRDGMAHGIGLIYHPNGDQYEGEFLNGQANGFGGYIYANGQRYFGFWRNDL